MVKSTDDIKSRYIQGGLTDVLPNRLGWWERRLLDTNVTDIEYIIEPKYHNRPDKLSSDLYGTPFYQTFILQYNNILDDLTEFVEGNKILLPTPQRLSMDIMTQPLGGNIVRD
jgi:hypothetical protein